MKEYTLEKDLINARFATAVSLSQMTCVVMNAMYTCVENSMAISTAQWEQVAVCLHLQLVLMSTLQHTKHLQCNSEPYFSRL